MNSNGLYFETYLSEKKSDETIILLHGLTGNTTRWKEYIPELKTEYNLIAIDLVGHGNSDFPDTLENYSVQAQAERIENLLQQEKITNVSIICHSYSCSIALAMIRRQKTAFDRLIMISPFFLEKARMSTVRMAALKILMPLWKYFPHRRKINKFCYPNKSEELSFLDHKKAIEEIGLKSYLAHLDCGMRFRCDQEGVKITIPSLLIYKEGDRLFTEEMKDVLYLMIPGLAEKRIAGAGHLYLFEDKEEILEAIKSFLRQASVVYIHYRNKP